MFGRLVLLCALALLVWGSVRIEPLKVAEAQQVTLTATLTALPSATALGKTPTPVATVAVTAIGAVDPPAVSSPTAAAPPTSAPIVQLPTRTPTRISTATPTPTRTPTLAPTSTPTRTVTPTRTTTPTASATATVLPPAITDVATSSITRSSATITWTTSQLASSQVDFGGPTDIALRPVRDRSLVTAHRIVLGGLQPGSTYRFLVRSVTAAGGNAAAAPSTLTTLPAGSGPEVGDVGVRAATSTTAVIGWATSTGTVAQLEYGATSNYGSFTLLKVFSGPDQQIQLTGLAPATAYHLRVKAWDGQGALGASSDVQFSTAPNGPATLIGDDTVQPDRVTLRGGEASAYQYVATQSGQASVVRLYVDAGSNAPLVRVAVYADQAGTPGSILSQGSAPALVPGWTAISMPPFSILQGTRYWIGVLNPLGAGVLNVRHAPIGGSTAVSTQASLAAMPEPFVVGAPAAHSPLSASVEQIPPALTLTGALDGSVVSGQVQLSAVVDDDAPLTRMQFYVDGLAVGPALTSAPYVINWNTTGLNPAVPHTIAARASDVLGRSGTSPVASVQVDNGPRISNVNITNGITLSSMRVTWSTDLPSDGQVEYGQTTGYELSTPVDPSAATRHDMQLTGLAPGAEYHFRVKSRDANGAAAVSDDGVFYTLP